MYAANGKISDRQTFRLYVFDLFGISTLLIPPYLAGLCGSDGFFAILFGSLSGYVYLRYLGYIMGKMDTDLGTFLEQRHGKCGQKISFAMLFFHCCFTAGFVVYVFCNLIQYSLIKEVNYVLLLAVVIIAAAYGVSGGIENRARVYEVLFWFILIPYVVMMLMSVGDLEMVHLSGFGESRPIDVIKSSFLVFLFLTPIFFSLFLTGNCKKKKYGTRMAQIISYAVLISVVILLGSYVILLGSFGRESLSNMRFPVVTLMSTIQIKGTFLKRMDALMLGVWFFTLLALFSLHMHYGTQMLKRLLHKDNKRLVAAAAGIVFVIAWLLKKTANGTDVFLGYYAYVAAPLMIIGPGLILLTGKKGKKLIMLFICCFAGGLAGCGATELESRCFPMMAAIDYDTENEKVLFFESFPGSENKTGISVNEIQIPSKSGDSFAESKTEFEKALNKLADYNHLKVIVIGKNFLENETAYADMIKLLAETEEFPRNTYICVTEDTEKLIALKEELPDELGAYLEEYLENHEDGNGKIISLGDLIDEQANKDRILYAPFLKTKETYVEWDGSYLIGENKNPIE